MSVIVDVLVEDEGWEALGDVEDACERAVAAAVALHPVEGEAVLALLLADDATLADLNTRFRGKRKPTNVLSFPAAPEDTPPGQPRLLGDVALARETVLAEAREQGKLAIDHMIHLVVHGTLHILGYDHEDEADAAIMEGLEVRALAALGIADPYRDAA